MSAPRFPVYQIDFSAVASGKRVAATKRRIRWRFGFPSKEALDVGKTGTDCRGEEHDIVVVWSVTSGKRQIMMDGREVTYASTRTGIMDHSWSTRGGHVMKVVCHAAAPMSANPGFRQYDMFIDGQSFFSMPKVYELGLRSGVAPPIGGMSSPRSLEYSGTPGGYSPSTAGPPIHPPRNTAEEEQELQRAINASLDESRRHLEARGHVDGGNATQTVSSEPDLFGFDSASAPAPAAFDTMTYNSAPNGYANQAPPQQQQQQQQQYGAPPAQYGAPPAQYGAPPPGQPMLALPSSSSYGSAPPPQQQYAPPPTQYQQSPPPQQQGALLSPGSTGDAFAPEDAFAPKPPSHNDIANEILNAYGGGNTPTAAASAQMWSPQQQPGPMPGQHLTLEHTSQPNGVALTMGGLAQTEEEPANAFEAALKKLVNVDCIDEPAEQQLKLTMKKQEDENTKKNKGKSRGIAPTALGQVGSNATLSQINEVKPTSAQKEGIMNAPPQTLFHPNAHMAGALVIHGQGPPPLQQQGFGVGFNNGYAAGPSYGYPPQQQQQPQYQYR